MPIINLTTPGKTENSFGKFVFADLEADGAGFSGEVFVQIGSQPEIAMNVAIPRFSQLRLRIPIQQGMGTVAVSFRVDGLPPKIGQITC